MSQHEATGLWSTAFGNAAVKTDIQKTARDDLLAAYRKLEERVKPILDKIPESCKGLTLHDISHVHQLWTVADEICGPNYPLNPLEGFVLGAAFLIHDAGLTASAYPDGLEGIIGTKFYRDRVAALLRKQNGKPPSAEEIDSPPASVATSSLFDTLRAIHAKRAETLLAANSPHPLTGEPYPLFPDADLFLDCGEIIGLIAASHHWPIHAVDSVFQQPRTPPAAFIGWSIDALKLACILRASDACAIDERRARIMPFLLANPKGVSLDHWTFQANLKPCVRRDEALAFESKVPFDREQMSAWWTAYDAITVADRELRDCDRLLRARTTSGRHPALQAFVARRVDGTNDPERLKEMLRVSGWTPVDTAVRIENPLALIEKLGGWELYGDDVSVPLRELIQNAADAVRARRRTLNAYTSDATYPGRVDILLAIEQSHKDSENVVLTISDDGIGMPPDRMTGVLLDFGRSFWSTEEAARNYPGLLSDPYFEPTGRFGIGFFAVFMIAENVKVISRPWDAGIKEVKVLHFRHGLIGRAELRDHNEVEDGLFPQDRSSVIRAVINRRNWLNWVAGLSAQRREPRASENQVIDIWELLERTTKQLVFALDVECRLTITGRAQVTLNQPGLLERSAEEFVQAYNDVLADKDDTPVDTIVPEEVDLIEGIKDQQGRTHSRGVVDSEGKYGWCHIGGLSVFNRRDGLMKGVVAYTPGGAVRRGGTRLASQEALITWGTEQLLRTTRSSMSLEQRFGAVANLASVGIDVTENAMLRSDDQVMTIKEIVRSLSDRASLFIAIKRHLRKGSWELGIITTGFQFQFWKFSDLTDRRHDLRLGGSSSFRADRYDAIEGTFEAPKNRISGYATLVRELISAGYSLVIEPPSNVIIGVYSGPKGGRGRLRNPELRPGSEVSSYGLVIQVKRTADASPTM